MSNRVEANEIRLIRLYEVPVATVWESWVDSNQAAQWWGPRGFTLTSHSKDFQPGGMWKYTMHGPDGTDFPNFTKYLEIEPRKKLVYDHGGSETGPPMFRVTVLFTETDGQTITNMTMAFPSAQAAEATRKYIKKAGGDACWDRFAEYLRKKSTGDEVFVINRTFATSVSRMYEMWTSPEHFSRWLAPTGFEMKFLRSDLRAGGSSFYVMTGPNNAKMHGRSEYIEVRRPDRIVYRQQFCDEHERVSRHPMSPTWPETMQTEVAISPEDEQSRVTVTWQPVGSVTPEELATFVAGRAGMTQGWTGSFDKLEEYLAGG